MSDNPKVLVLFSGGKDSFLTACRLASQQHEVHLISFNNGAVVCEENLLHGVTRLQNRYGKDLIQYDGAYCTSATICQLNKAWTYMSWRELGQKYPDLANVQMTCLHCQTAMWVAAIAYAKAKKIPAIAAGYKSMDEFCTGLKPWIDRISSVAAKNKIAVLTPLWTTPEWGADKTAGRDMEMIDHSFEPQVLEPKCLLGRPAVKPSNVQATCMMSYFDDLIEAKMRNEIKRLIPVFSHSTLSDCSIENVKYPVPTGEGGIF